jgi:uncharacterized phage protein gp47/JayE
MTTPTDPPLAAHATVNAIIARISADVVAGIDPTSPDYPDLTPGSIISDLLGGVALEIARVYDATQVEMRNAVMPGRTFGQWLDEWAAVVGLERLDETKATGAVTMSISATAPAVTIASGTRVSTEAPSDDDDEVVFEVSADTAVAAGGGDVVVPVTAVTAGVEGNVPTHSITLMISANPYVEAVTNELPTTGGTDVEEDPALRDRVIRRLATGGGGGNVSDYEDWALQEPGVGHVTVVPNWAGDGTVLLVVTDPLNQPVSEVVRASLQDRLDPADGEGDAPIGADVTVAVPAQQLVRVSVGTSLADGTALDEAPGVRSLRQDIVDSVEAYFATLTPGSDVVAAKLLAAVVDVDGVTDATLFEPAANVSIPVTSVATLSDLSIS